MTSSRSLAIWTVPPLTGSPFPQRLLLCRCLFPAAAGLWMGSLGCDRSRGCLLAIAVEGMAFSRSLPIWIVHPFTCSPEGAALSVPFPCGCRSLDGLLVSAIAVEGGSSSRSLAIWSVHPSSINCLLAQQQTLQQLSGSGVPIEESEWRSVR